VAADRALALEQTRALLFLAVVVEMAGWIRPDAFKQRLAPLAELGRGCGGAHFAGEADGERGFLEHAVVALVVADDSMDKLVREHVGDACARSNLGRNKDLRMLVTGRIDVPALADALAATGSAAWPADRYAHLLGHLVACACELAAQRLGNA